MPGSVSWARLEEAGHLPLSTVLGTRDNTDSPHGGGTHVVGGDTSIMTPEPGDGPPEGPRRGNSGTKKGEIKGDGGLECRDSSQNREKRHERREPLYLHDWSLPQNLGPDSALLAGRFQVQNQDNVWLNAVGLDQLDVGSSRANNVQETQHFLLEFSSRSFSKPLPAGVFCRHTHGRANSR